ncbi:Pvc16 family protein [Streptomyces sp. WAC06614]|uniref:Pvc16 family protein n=1 Tax=Streptomyces sp. WAC06614 TaxID=2487416 RepID=UPI000F772BEA|nr:Pvc16 family protein [Streptomyces sp. WAC06614]RSS75506.1 DUF4255 domain-containing protein [Streptomyces sp. WAC06614]
MLHACSAALRGHLETALAGRGTVTAEPPPASLTEAPGPDGGLHGGPRGLGVHLFQVTATDQVQAVDSVGVRDHQGRVVGRRAPVRRYRTRWLVWSWAPTAAERLALLDRALASLGAEPVLPAEVAGPELVAGGPVHLVTAPVADGPGELAGVFAGLGVPARPALEVVLTAGLAPALGPVPQPPSEVRVVPRPHPVRPARPAGPRPVPPAGPRPLPPTGPRPGA